jgi:hypothetical protein
MDMIKPKEIGRALLTISSDLTAEPVWQYQELPPFLLPELSKLNWQGADDSELSRAAWFWLRRPKSTFCEGRTALVLEGLCLLLFVMTAFVGSSEISISELAIEVTIVLFAVVIGIGAIVYQVKLVQWRREYERSVNRLIRTIYRGA